MSKKYRTYPEEFKLSVIRDYYSSGVSRYACAKKHGIASLLLRKWLLKYRMREEAWDSLSIVKKMVVEVCG